MNIQKQEDRHKKQRILNLIVIRIDKAAYGTIAGFNHSFINQKIEL